MPSRRISSRGHGHVEEGAIPAKELYVSFPRLDLPINPPFAPMEAKAAPTLPTGAGWQYEPKWDGFRCLAFRDHSTVVLQSKSGQSLTRYFPELVAELSQVPAERFVLDGEIVIILNDRLSFDDLLMRIHPAQSRIQKLSKQTPCTLLLFDLLVDEKGRSLVDVPLSERRQHLTEFHERFLHRSSMLKLSTATTSLNVANNWFVEFGKAGCDGVVAKELNAPYESGERSLIKVKRIRSADCVVGGFRFASKGGAVGSLLLGLYGDDGRLHHVGFTSSFTTEQRKALLSILEPQRGGSGFTGNSPGGPSRWSTERSGQWEPLAPSLVVEVQYDHFSGGRFRHGTKFLRWRPDKPPEACTMDQVVPAETAPGALDQLIA